MSYIKTFEKFNSESLNEFGDFLQKLCQQLDKIKSYGQQLNRNRLGTKPHELSEEFKHYFYTMTDEGWRYYSNQSPFYFRIILEKPIKKVDAEREFNIILDNMLEIKSRMTDEGFNSHFMIFFNDMGQQENNPKTYKNDLYKYKGIGDKDCFKYRDLYSKYSNDEYFLAEIKLVLI